MDSPNVVIYGHHMSDGTMFADIAGYANKDYLDAHPTIFVQTPQWIKGVTVRACDVVTGTSATTTKRTGFSGAGELWDYLVARHDTSVVKRPLPEKADLGQLVTLVTCSYQRTDDRTLLIGTTGRN
jgi:sortase B